MVPRPAYFNQHLNAGLAAVIHVARFITEKCSSILFGTISRFLQVRLDIKQSIGERIISEMYCVVGGFFLNTFDSVNYAELQIIFLWD